MRKYALLPTVSVFRRPVALHVLLVPCVLPLERLRFEMDFLPLSAVRLGWFTPLLALTAGAWLLLWVLTRNARTSALAVTLVTATITLDRSLTSICDPAWQSPVMGLVWLAACALGSILVFRGGDARALTLLANVVVGVVVASLAVDVVVSDVRRRPHHREPASIASGSPLPATARPDVVILVLDGYGRADVLRDLYGYEDPLVEALRGAGFYVAEKAAANYAQTALSLSSSLNLDYLANLAPGLSPTEFSRRVPAALIARNRSFTYFRQAGYRIVTFTSEYSMVQFDEADEERRWWLHGTDLDYAIYDVSGLPRVFRWINLPQAWLPHEARRRGLKWTLDALRQPDLFSADRPTLVFAHVLLPHPPFVLNPDGTPRPSALRAGVYDGDHWWRNGGGNQKAYKAGYIASVEYLGWQVARVVKALSTPGREVSILVYGDHGPGSCLRWDSKAATDLRERMGILLALRPAPSSAASLYPTMTPVNAMRGVLQAALGIRLPFVDDRSYFSTWTQPYRFSDVTARVQ